LGIVFYTIFTQKGLFEGNFIQSTDFLKVNKVCDLSHVPKELRNAPSGAKELIIKMLAIKP